MDFDLVSLLGLDWFETWNTFSNKCISPSLEMELTFMNQDFASTDITILKTI